MCLSYYELTRKACSSGGIGRRVGLKIQSGAISVPVQVWPGANKKTHVCESFFLFIEHFQHSQIPAA